VMAGFSQGGGVGLVVSNWMVDGDPGLDTWGMDVSRFGDWLTPAYTADTVRQFYSRRFTFTYPNEELPAGRDMRHVPIHGELKAQGASFGVSYGIETPNWYAGAGAEPAETPTFKRSEAFARVAEEVDAVRTGAGLMEISTFAKYRVAGKDASAWLDKVMTARPPEPGRLRLTSMLDEHGRVIGDFTMANLDGEEFRVFGAGAAENYHLRWFGRAAQGFDVQVDALGLDLTGLAVSGPKSRALLGGAADDPAETEGMRFFDCRRLRIAGVDALVGRISFTGELGYEIWVAPADQPKLFAALLEEGKKVGLRLYGGRALQSLRIEKGYGSWATEYRPIYTPVESGIDRLIDLSKEEFVGREAYAAIKEGKPKRKLVALGVESEDVDAVGDEPILSGNETVGWITSGSYGHHLKKSMALGYVRHELAGGSSPLEVEILGERHSARVLPSGELYDPGGGRMRA